MAKEALQPAPEDEKFERWTAQRKAAIILEVLKGQVSVPEAARKYGFTQGEFIQQNSFQPDSRLSVA